MIKNILGADSSAFNPSSLGSGQIFCEFQDAQDYILSHDPKQTKINKQQSTRIGRSMHAGFPSIEGS